MMEYSKEQIALIRRTCCEKANDDEFNVFLDLARRTGLDPLARQIYAVGRWDSRKRREVMSVQTSIEGLRLVADRSGKYEGQLGPHWCGDDGRWQDVWLEAEPPSAARVGVLRTGFREPLWGVARWTTYAQKTRDGKLTPFWGRMPELMLAKVAEAAALRKAFPQDLSGVYVREELDTAPDTVPETPSGEWVLDADHNYVWNGSGDPDQVKLCETFEVLAKTPGDDAERLLQKNRDMISGLPPRLRDRVLGAVDFHRKDIYGDTPASAPDPQPEPESEAPPRITWMCNPDSGLYEYAGPDGGIDSTESQRVLFAALAANLSPKKIPQAEWESALETANRNMNLIRALPQAGQDKLLAYIDILKGEF